MVSRDKTYLSHLLFVDDTFFFWSGKETFFFVNMRGLFSFFETIYGLKINKGKSLIIGINCDPLKFHWASLVGCGMSYIRFSYLGLPLCHVRSACLIGIPF